MRPPLLIPSPDLESILKGDFQAIYDAFVNTISNLNQLSTLIAGRVGTWIDEPYDAAAYTTNSTGLWTVQQADQVDFSYLRIDDILFVNLSLVGTTIGNGTTTELRVRPPGGYLLNGSHAVRGAAPVWNNGAAAAAGALFVQGGGTFISVQRCDGTLGAGFPFSGGSDDFHMGFFAMFKILNPSGN